MAINFPNSPNLNETHTDGGRTWSYDGEKWVLLPNPLYLDDIFDVDLTSAPPSTGDVLSYNGSEWVSASVSSGLPILDIDGGNQLLSDILEAEVTNWPVATFDGGIL